MSNLLTEARAAALPFVTRTLRGPRLRRMWALSAVVFVASLLAGWWAARDTDPGARHLRTAMGWEQPRHEAELEAFTVFADTHDEFRDLVVQAERVVDSRADGSGRFGELYARTCWSLGAAAAAGNVRAQAAFAGPTCAAFAVYPERVPIPSDAWVDLVVDRDLQPQVAHYRSPLGLAATLGVMGWVAGAVVGIGLLLVGPLLAGIQMAQEVHDNTLQPLTGTALTARHLALGMPAGPLAAVGLVLLGPAVTLVVGGVAGGRPDLALGALLTAAIAGALLVVVAQLVALVLARHRSPGIVTMLLATCLGGVGIAAAAMATDVHGWISGMVATWPGASAVHLWTQAFAPGVHHLDAREALGLDLRIVAASVGTLTVLGLGQLVTERRIVGRPGALLSRREGAIAAVVLAAMAVMAVPPDADDFGAVYLASLAMLLGPLQLVLMTRVPGGERPLAGAVVPLTTLLAEYFAVLGVHMLLVAVVADAPDASALNPGGPLHLGWAAIVLALVTIRATAGPTSIPTKLWMAIVVVACMFVFGIGAALAASGRGDMLPVLEAPVLVALVFLTMLVLAPWSMVRGLSKAGAELR